MSVLIKHLNEEHEQHLSYEHLSFETDQLFKEWLCKIENDVPCSFNRSQTVRKNRPEIYICNRRRVSDPSKAKFIPRKRKLKVQGRSYVGFTCPAHIKRKKDESGVYVVQYLAKHFCNADKLKHMGHVRLTEQDRKWIAGMLNLGIPAQTIIRRARMNLNNQLTRRFLVTRSDLRNIATSYNISKPERRHADDATSVEAFVRSFANCDDCPIILYKRQGDSHIDIGPDQVTMDGILSNDFLLGYMNSSQCEMLKGFGTKDLSVVCCDSTHGTNAYNFLLTTVMVLDSNREGFPVAFLFSNRESESVLALFFKAIKQQSGQIHCQSFMSDMAPQSYNAWSSVMGDSDNHLYCAWHVDKAFRENIQHRVKDSESRANTYKMVRTLMVERDVTAFEATKRYVLAQLNADEKTIDFATYLESNYFSCSQRWAYCYRKNCGVNTNMALERMHGLLKYNYQNGKKNKRLDSAIQSVVYMLEDRQVDRLLTLCRGKYCRKLADLHKRHDTSLSLDVQCFEISPNREWTVQSSSDEEEFYNVTKSEKTCHSCNLKCDDCHACIHDFLCTCSDMGIKYQMCKHIHYICTKYPHERGAEVPPDDDCPIALLTIDEDEQRNRAQAEADAHIAQLSRSYHTDTDICANRDEARRLAKDTLNLIESVTDNDGLLAIIDKIREIRPHLDAVIASKNEAEFLTTNKRIEPSNKKIEPQRKFKKISNPKKRKNKLTKPSVEFTKDLLLSAVTSDNNTSFVNSTDKPATVALTTPRPTSRHTTPNLSPHHAQPLATPRPTPATIALTTPRPHLPARVVILPRKSFPLRPVVIPSHTMTSTPRLTIPSHTMTSTPRLTVPSLTMTSTPRLAIPSHSHTMSSTLHPLTTPGTSRIHHLPSWLYRRTGNQSDEEDEERGVFLYS